jgi:hypothetical protein
MTQTPTQILRCLTLGGYTARVVEGRLETEGPQPLAGPLPASIEARHDELVTFLNDHYAGTWPPPRRSREIREREYLHKRPREERAREFLAQLRERRERAA